MNRLFNKTGRAVVTWRGFNKTARARVTWRGFILSLRCAPTMTGRQDSGHVECKAAFFVRDYSEHIKQTLN
jgi:hypothetical protein